VFASFAASIASLDLVAIAFALLVYASNRRQGTPWLVAAMLITAQAIVAYVAADLPGFTAAFIAYGQLPAGVTLASGLFAGALAGRLGWLQGKPPSRRPRAVLAA
jgi:hypothetical protein